MYPSLLIFFVSSVHIRWSFLTLRSKHKIWLIVSFLLVYDYNFTKWYENPDVILIKYNAKCVHPCCDLEVSRPLKHVFYSPSPPTKKMLTLDVMIHFIWASFYTENTSISTLKSLSICRHVEFLETQSIWCKYSIQEYIWGIRCQYQFSSNVLLPQQS